MERAFPRRRWLVSSTRQASSRPQAKASSLRSTAILETLPTSTISRLTTAVPSPVFPARRAGFSALALAAFKARSESKGRSASCHMHARCSGLGDSERPLAVPLHQSKETRLTGKWSSGRGLDYRFAHKSGATAQRATLVSTGKPHVGSSRQHVNPFL